MPVKSQYPDLTIPDVSLSDFILDLVKTYGDRVALIDNFRDGKSLTYNEIYTKVKTCAGFLHGQGLKKGDFVGLAVPSCMEFPLALLGIISRGAIATPCNPAYTKGEILQQFKISQPRMVFVHENAVETMKKVASSLSFIEKIFVIGESEEFTTFDMILKTKFPFPESVKIDAENDVAMLPYSSGTTGLPKSVMVTHKNLVSLASIYKALFKYHKLGVTYTDRPMYHAGGYCSLLESFSLGITHIIDAEFEIERALATIEKYKVTCMLAVPPMMIKMANAEINMNYDISSLKELLVGGAALSTDVMRRITEKYEVNITPAYGMTEGGLLACNQNQQNHPTSVGTIPPNTELKIVDLQTGTELPANKDGEILAKTPQVMKGYMKNPEASKLAFDEEGWYHTGDIGHIDDEGMVYVVDRIKEVIKYKTFQVPPAELENVILKHPKVSDVGVIGIPDKLVGEIPKAFVVKKDDSLTGQEIISFVQGELTDYKHLRGGVQFIIEVPKSPLGKIQRKELKRIAGIE